MLCNIIFDEWFYTPFTFKTFETKKGNVFHGHDWVIGTKVIIGGDVGKDKGFQHSMRSNGGHDIHRTAGHFFSFGTIQNPFIVRLVGFNG